ncbi:peptidoglycan DD-metalloendopeptidase family protein (plasmid) [Streptomyces sp. QHH-9511]|uniref:peptidoglycan DD-metalloendopeptidase family protein n=1 Tax=Streptomyces sp. QHH-9511 TaxID=2684468 RepID=UPI001316161A|nr:peptidoglycan DD-metalloendopeptidase family protein [Streptomyces sp. QHH-9511]QGZ53370.1 peptidoglycan DD-metalloendopeptidase family protein [Streptomyces sp. QHH-9511]
MAEASVVGSTRVTLIPDVSQFGDRLRVELPSAIREPARAAGDLAGDTIRNAISKKLAKPIGVRIKTVLDDRATSAALQKLTKDRTVKITAELDDKAATAGLTRLTRDRTVKIVADVDDTAAKTKLGALSGQQTVHILPKIQQAAYLTAQRQLDRLTADRVVSIRATVDTRVAAQDIRNLIQRRHVRIGADVDTRVAANDLANLTRRRQVTIAARADTAAADTALRFLTRDRTVNVRVRSIGLAALTGGLSTLGSSGGGGVGLSLLSKRVLALTAATLAALPTIASLGSAIAQLGPLAATAAPAITTLVTAFAAIKVGTKGVGDAIKAAFEPAAGEASKAASATRAVENAQRSLARAQRSLQDAQVQAAERVRQAQRQVADAERDLSSAQRDARQAQMDLSAARREAARDLQDMNNRLADGRLSEREATLSLQQAEEDLTRVRTDPAATQLQIQQAELSRDRAVQSLQTQRVELSRLQKDTAAATKAGIDGSAAVGRAKQQMAAAEQNVADRQRALAEAQLEVTKAQVDGQRQIADAHMAVADAVRSVADAQQAAATQTSALDTAMAKLSPNARAFVTQLQAMAPAWRSMRLDVQDSLFADLGTRLGQVGAQILPTVRQGLVGAAGELNAMGKNALTAVSNLQKTGQLKSVFDGATQSLRNLSRLPGQMVTGLAQLSIAAQPAFNRMTTGLAGAMDRVMEKLSAGLADGSLTETINTALDVAIAFGKVLGDLGGIIAGIFRAAGAAGGDFFGTIGVAIAELRRIIELPEVQATLTEIFKALNAVAKLFVGVLGAALQAILPLLAALSPVIVQLAEQLGPVFAELFRQLGTALGPIITALLPIITTVGSVLTDLVTTLLPLLQPIGDLIAEIVTALAPVFTVVGEILTTVLQAAVTGLRPVILALLPAVGLIGQLLADLAPLFPPLLQALMPLFPPLTQLTLSLLNLAVQILIPLMPLIVGLATLLTGVLAKAIEHLVPIFTTVIGWFTTFVDACTAAVKWVVEKFMWLWDVLLGHSIIPDIVNGTVEWFRRLWRWLGDLVARIVGGVVGWFTNLKNDTVRIWDALWGKVRSIASTTWGLVKAGFDKFATSLKTAFGLLRDGIGTVWSGLKKLVSSPVKFFVETVYNKGLVQVWNATAGKIPGLPDMKPMPLPKGFARGGILPGWSTWRDGDDQLVPMRRGEGVYVSEVMADPYERQRLYAMNQAAIRGQNPAVVRAQYGFAEGGIIGSLTSIGSGIADSVGSALKKGAGAVRGGLADVAEQAFKPIKSGINKALGNKRGTWPGMVAAAPLHLIDRAIDYIRGKDVPESTGRWLKPVNAPFGTKFGVKGRMWSSGRHTGLDFPAATGTKILAVDNGTVQQATSGGPYGQHVLLSHGGGLQSLYAHMSSIAARVGAGVKQGARIGAVGATGNVTGPHLHLEARLNGKSVDPMSYLTGPTSGGDGGSGVQRWRGVVQQALGQVHQSLGLVNTTLRRMNQESGGNPRAVNLWDSNAKAGYPSVGLMQVIRDTFRAHAGPYRNTGPFMYGVSVDPLANIYASMKYALARYGSLSRAYDRPGGYARGGLIGGTRIHRGRGYATGGVITIGGKKISTGPIGAAVGADFLKQLTGTAAQIKAAMDKVATAIKNSFKGVYTTLDEKLLTKLKTANTQLQNLAKSRDQIAAKIAAANQLAADSTAQAGQFTQMTSLPTGGNTFDAAGILSGLNVRLGQLKTFGKNLQTLAARGLSKALLQQIIAAGPDQGAAYAKALVDATPAQLKQINATQDALGKASAQYGQDAADAMYDAGAQSGKGYLAGLKAQEQSINTAMSALAKKIQKAIKDALKIKSPSRVFAEIGRFTVAGFAQGIRQATPEAAASTAQMAALVRGTAAATMSRIENNASSSTTVGDRHLHYNATVREQASRASILAALSLEDALHRPVVMGV